MIPPFFNKPLSALLLFLFLFIPQSFARDDRDNPMKQFASLLGDTLKASSCNERNLQSSKPQGKTSSPSAMKQKQNQQKQKRLFEKSAREAEKLIKKYKIDINQEVEILTQKTTPVAVVAESGNVPMMEVLIKHGVNLNQEGYTYYGRTGNKAFPAIIVAESGNVPMMELLIKHGVNLDQKVEKRNRDNILYTHPEHSLILNAAVASGHIPMIKLLLQHIPNADISGLGTTYLAARRGDLNMLRFLKEQGIPFHSACLGQAASNCKCRKPDCPHLAVMRYLLEENGFDIKRDHGSSLYYACWNENEILLHFLLEHGAECDINTTPSYAVCPSSGPVLIHMCMRKHENVNIIKTLLAKGANIHATSKHSTQNALHVASYNNCASAVPILIKAGLDVNTRDSDGKTPLILAAQLGWLETVKILLDQGADVSAKDHKGKTAADYALEASNHTEETLNGSNFDKEKAGEVYRLLSKSR
ncbi:MULTISPECIES: ankyrin repeat domain-containing protein [unclassified Akkermansia]|nr:MULTISPECIES: ankyrin repeat domain-containing protein [unclassified Akkermansia]